GRRTMRAWWSGCGKGGWCTKERQASFHHRSAVPSTEYGVPKYAVLTPWASFFGFSPGRGVSRVDLGRCANARPTSKDLPRQLVRGVSTRYDGSQGTVP